MDSFLNVYFLFQVSIFKMYEIQRIIAAGVKNRHLKRKEPRLSAAALSFNPWYFKGWVNKSQIKVMNRKN